VQVKPTDVHCKLPSDSFGVRYLCPVLCAVSEKLSRKWCYTMPILLQVGGPEPYLFLVAGNFLCETLLGKIAHGIVIRVCQKVLHPIM
jgi:hypothetical protein